MPPEDTIRLAVPDSLVTLPPEVPTLGGTLMLPVTDPGPLAVHMQWMDYPLNWIGVTVCTIIFVLTLRTFIHLLPTLWGGLWWEKMILNLEDSVPNTRDRNRLFAATYLPACFLASKYSIFHPSFLAPLGDGLNAIGIIAATAGFFLLRQIIFVIIAASDPAVKCRKARVAQRSVMNFWIVGTFVLCILACILSTALINSDTVRYILIGFGILIYLLFIIRKTEILLSFCNPLKAFSYLCALELIPLAAMVATGLFL